MRTLLIDTDITAFVASVRAENKYDFGDTGCVRETDVEKAKAEAMQLIAELIEDLKADDAILCLSCPGRVYFRHEILPSYKEHRTSGEPPLALKEVKTHLREQTVYKTYCKPSLEGDDCLGILATHPTLVRGEKVLVSADKDMKQIPGLLYNTRKPGLGVQEITKRDADLFFYTQCLSGDPTDGYKGCPGIGPVKAKKILADAQVEELFEKGQSTFHPAYWRAIVATYAAKGLDESHALAQARVARILRHTDYDYTNKKPILWTPELSSSIS